MSNENTTPSTDYYGRPAGFDEKPRRRRWIPTVLLCAGALAVGFGAGAAGSSEPAAAPVPTPTVTETAPAPEAERVEVEVTTDACREALDYADNALSTVPALANIAARFIELIPAAAEAGLYQDTAGVEQVTATMGDLNAETEELGSTYQTANGGYLLAAEECRGAGA